jgi:hypothetical protein
LLLLTPHPALLLPLLHVLLPALPPVLLHKQWLLLLPSQPPLPQD